MKLLHIIPGLDPGASKSLWVEHSRALESISRAAQTFSRPNVELKAVQVCDPFWPPVQVQGISVHRKTIDTVGVDHGGEIRPLLRSFFPEDLVDDQDFIVFSNSDICVTQDFYETVFTLIDGGALAGSIHRKTILGVDPSDLDSLERAEGSDNWYFHPGSDCFFFPTQTAGVLRSRGTLMGIPPVAKDILLTVSVQNPSFKEFSNLRVTYHFGDERVWKISPQLQKLMTKNILRWYWTLPGLIKEVGLKNFLRGLSTLHLNSFTDFSLFFIRQLMYILRGFAIRRNRSSLSREAP